jgi:fructuronate reductase
MRYVTGTDENGRPIDVRDPMAARLREIADRAGGSAERLAGELFGAREIFGDDLPGDVRFTGAVTAALAQLYAKGARRTVAGLVAG